MVELYNNAYRQMKAQRDELKDRVAELETLNSTEIEVSANVRRQRDEYKARVAGLEAHNGFIQAQKIAELLDLRVGSDLVESATRRIGKLLVSEARVVKLEAGMCRLRDRSPGDWELTCNGEAFNELMDMLLWQHAEKKD